MQIYIASYQKHFTPEVQKFDRLQIEYHAIQDETLSLAINVGFLFDLAICITIS